MNGDTNYVLLVENSLIVQHACTTIINGFDDELCIAENEDDALSLLSNICFNLVLIDIEIPDLNGKKIIETVRKSPAPVKIIILSSYLDQRALATYAKIVDHMCKKPVTNLMYQKIRIPKQA